MPMVGNSAALQERLKIDLPMLDQMDNTVRPLLENNQYIDVIRFHLPLYQI